MSELLREIEDDIRREKFDQLWQHFGRVMVGVSIAVVLATIVVVIVQNHRQARAMEQTGQFIAGIDRFDLGDYKGAIEDFSILTGDESSPYYDLAMLRKAQALSASGDKDGATQTYKTLAAHGGPFSELAKMQDTDRLIEPDKKSPFYYTQSEWRGWQLMQAGKKDEAVTEFIALRDNVETPFSLRQRMREVVQHLAPERNDSKYVPVSSENIEDKK